MVTFYFEFFKRKNDARGLDAVTGVSAGTSSNSKVRFASHSTSGVERAFIPKSEGPDAVSRAANSASRRCSQRPPGPCSRRRGEGWPRAEALLQCKATPRVSDGKRRTTDTKNNSVFPEDRKAAAPTPPSGPSSPLRTANAVSRGGSARRSSRSLPAAALFCKPRSAPPRGTHGGHMCALKCSRGHA